MNIKNLLPKTGLVLFAIIALASCEEDISNIGSEILGTEAPNGVLDDSSTIIAYSRGINSVQTNVNLNDVVKTYQLGIYNDPVYGKSSANFLSQLLLSQPDPKFGTNANADSVFLYVPYFSTRTVTTEETTYKLDSLFGDSPINISVFSSNYFLRDTDPNSGFSNQQVYYSDDGSNFDAFQGEELVRIENFKPSASPYVVNAGEDNEETLAPGIRVKMSADFFQNNIILKEGSQELLNNLNFKNFLRGIYLKVDSPNADGNLFLFDQKAANISIFYSSDDPDNAGEKLNSEFKLNFSGVGVNTFETNFPQPVKDAITNPDTENGEANLYLKGGEGIISVIELFGKDLDGNGVADELDNLRDKNWLINEANLIFYVDQDLVGTASEPDRIIIYDLKNSSVLIDYSADITTGPLEPANAYTVHLGDLQKDSDGNGQFYKIRITNHITNLIVNNGENVKLGIAVSQNVKTDEFNQIRVPLTPGGVKNVPYSSVIAPKGTVLYGNTSTNLDKRLKLQIYYTDPK